ncbi:uncharacterized protein LOC143446175 [Clavelina lepadiformis]|uniref:uncharacterized protein LOC143446175 n=1 Tax=Clavelina lepadiformis TaxID=159417 RepID=UPI0040433829
MQALALVFIVIASTAGQSTTKNPQGFCASYLNRYTNDNQCIYSFIVPKKDRDHCPGLEAKLNILEDTINEMKLRQSTAEEQIRLLTRSEQNSRDLGAAQEQARILRDQNNALEADKQRLLQEKTDLQSRLNENHLVLTEDKNQLDEVRAKYAALQSNYSRMQESYTSNRQSLNSLQEKFDRTKSDLIEMQKAKNCSDINKHLPSCAVIRQWGYTESGYAMIDPDGEGGVDPFLVYCDMEDGSGVTVIEHDIQEKMHVTGCEGPGCFTFSVNYEASLEQITKLMDISLACEQFIRYDCYDSKLLKDDTAWWNSRRGEPQRYWGGAQPGSGKCACGMTNECLVPTEACNCDADSEEWLFDEGFLRDMSSLPVTGLAIGDVRDSAGEKGNITLGSLRCKWNVNMSVPSCDALRQSGLTGTGLYLIDPDGSGPAEPMRTHCDLRLTNQTTVTSPGSSPNTVQRPANPNEYHFTDCNQVPGPDGPTERMCNDTYLSSNVRVRVRQGTQVWQVPRNGYYRITAKAPSGYHNNPDRAGKGATVYAEFKFRRGTELRVLVGQRGDRNGGSGGTFVTEVFNTYEQRVLVIAGAGGSSLELLGNPPIVDASMNERAKDSSDPGTNYGHGGNSGNGGERGVAVQGPNTSGGGAGYNTNGFPSTDQRFSPRPTPAIMIRGLEEGKVHGRGGTYTYRTPTTQSTYSGGFGGGGSGSKSAPGGSGGYSGGGGGPNGGSSGGGGSKVVEKGKKRHILINNIGKGSVTVTYVREASDFADSL